MPELPEVETLRRELHGFLKGKKITAVEVLWPKLVAPLTPTKFKRELVGQTIKEIKRSAKVLIIDLVGPQSLLFHLKMTGQLIIVPTTGPKIIGGHPAVEDENVLPNKHTRLIITFTDHSKLYFNDLRKFGWAKLANDQQVKNVISGHGPEPLSKDFSPNFLSQLFKHYPNRSLKQILMDQKLIAGIGNIYADESCFLAGLKPERQAKTVSQTKIKELQEKIVEVLKHSIAKKGTSARDYRRSNGQPGGFVPYLYVYGRGGSPCKKCGTILKKIKHHGRGTVYCPMCQK